MFRRIAYFLLTNLLVVASISILTSMLGVDRYLTENGIAVGALFVLCLIYGMVGSVIALLLSRISAKLMARVTVIDPANPGQYRWLVEKVHSLARRADLPAMPEVGVYPSPEVNAFATGPTKSRSLVAVSEGLLATMNEDEIEGVLAHEVAHIQNGDMVTMTLIQGVVNAFVLFLSRALAYVIAQAVAQAGKSQDRENADISPSLFRILAFVLDLAFTFLGMLVVCYFSRKREFRADSGSAKLSGTKDKMIAALSRLGRIHEVATESSPSAALAALKINGKKGGWLHLFSTHPPIDKRIEALRQASLSA